MAGNVCIPGCVGVRTPTVGPSAKTVSTQLRLKALVTSTQQAKNIGPIWAPDG